MNTYLSDIHEAHTSMIAQVSDMSYEICISLRATTFIWNTFLYYDYIMRHNKNALRLQCPLSVICKNGCPQQQINCKSAREGSTGGKYVVIRKKIVKKVTGGI